MSRYFFLCLSICSISLVFLVSAPLTSAVTDEFTVQLLIGEDTLPPSVPILQSVVPLSTSQIDVTWLASVDFVGVAGYVVARDGVAVATTTLVTFSDTGLLPDTLYSYTVQAFDAAANYSTFSAPLATSTFALPPPASPAATTTPANTTDTFGTFVRPQLTGFSVTTRPTEAEFLLTVSGPTTLRIRWGVTAEYESASLQTEALVRTHTPTIGPLIPQTKYYYEITGITPRGVAAVLQTGSFTTPATELPLVPNVANLEAVVESTDVLLSWQRPFWIEGRNIQVVRNSAGFPLYPEDGYIVYRGDGTGVRDQGVLRGGEQFYTVFVIDADGRSSSGAVVKVRLRHGDTDPGTTVTEEVADPVGEVPVILFQKPHIRMPEPGYVLVIQNRESATFGDAPRSWRTDQPLVISIPAGAVANNIKSLIVTLVDPTDPKRSFSFLLRRGVGQAAYEGEIPPVLNSGHTSLYLDIYDFEAGVVGRYQKRMHFYLPGVVKEELQVVQWVWWLGSYGWWLLLLPLLWWSMRRLRNRLT